MGKTRSHVCSGSRGRVHFDTMSPPLALSCLLLGEERSHTITIKIQATETVATLKEEIWKKKPITLKHVEADNLILWMVRRLYIDYCID